MKTRKLYYEDCLLQSFTANVEDCLQTDRGWVITLDATGFYPEGGGQPCDLGTLGGVRVLDVREQDEYDAGHIPGAILIPNGQITSRAEQELPDKGQLILVYCRSGRRSKEAAQKLVKLGYTNIKEIGGIIDWPYDIEK